MTPNRFPTPCAEWKPGYDLKALQNESFYWPRVLAGTLNGIPVLGLPMVNGVVLAGLPGTGRHTTAEGLAGSLPERRDIHYFLRISGCALDTEDVADACAVVDGAVAKLRQHRKLCLMLDCPEQSRHSRAIQEYLLQQYLDHRAELFVIVITDAVGNISPMLLQKLTVCQFRKPDLVTRQRWLQSNLTRKDLPINLDDGMNHISLARETEGFSWRQMVELRTQLRRTIAFKYLSAPQTYNPSGIEGLENQIWRSGKIHLSQQEVFTILGFLREQNTAGTQTGTSGVQMVVAPATAAPAAAAAAAPASAAKATENFDPFAADNFKPMNKEEADKAKAFHAQPEKMSGSQLLNIDDL